LKNDKIKRVGKYLICFLLFISLFFFTGCSSKENEQDDKDKTTYTTGITDIMDALTYELGLAFYQGSNEIEDYGIGSDIDIIDANTVYIKAQDIDERLLTEILYRYLNRNFDIDIEKVWSPDEIKATLTELYGDNYQYQNHLTKQSVCSSLTYHEDKKGYYMEGGCVGMAIPSAPHVYIKILDKTDTTVTLGRVYVIPSKGKDEMEDTPPYQIYQNEKQETLLGTVDKKSDAFTTLKDKVDKYLITFDKDNGFYHFDHLEKIK